MSGKPAMFREREGKRIIALAKKAGAKVVEFEYNGVKATIRLEDAGEKSVEAEDQITL